MIKKYLDFVKYNKINENIGKWLEDLCDTNDEVLELLRPYLDDTDPTVRIANTINVLPEKTKTHLYNMVSKYIKENNETDIIAGKHVFVTFLKVITSIGMKDMKPNWDNIPDDFLLFFEYKTNYGLLIDKIERFQSLSMFIDKLPKENPKLYFGIKLNLMFSFGFIGGDKIVEIGNFKINKNAINYLLLLESPSAANLKRELAYLNADNLPLISKISNHIKEYHPGNTEKRTFKINDGILEFGYYGLGDWSNRIMNKENLDALKKGFIKHIINLKDHDKLLIAVKAVDMWVMVYVKIK